MKINTYILTGFLGAGKTTILNELIKLIPEQVGIIENEFGKVNIDSSLIEKKYDQLFELTDGCLCCSLNGELIQTLHEIIKNNIQIKNLFIETTGIADAGSLAAIFKQPEIAKYFQLKHIICIVDCTQVEEQIKKNPEITRQIISSDLVILNKAGNYETIKRKIEHLNPFCNCVYSTEKLFEEKWLELEPKNVKNFFRPILLENEGHRINSVLYETTQKYNLEIFRDRLQNLFNCYYHQVYRVKGYIQTEDGSMYLVQTTGQDVFISLPSDEIENKTQLVVIGNEIQLKTIERIFEPAIVKTKNHDGG